MRRSASRAVPRPRCSPWFLRGNDRSRPRVERALSPSKERAALSTLTAQAHRLIELGVDDLAELPAEEILAGAQALEAGATDGSLLVVHPSVVPPSLLTPLLERDGLPGFVVEDLTDLDEFVAIESVAVPQCPLYRLDDVERGDDLQNRSPEEALAALTERGRTPLTVSEGIAWLLQDPSRLEPNHCFMTIGSRKPRARGGLDARTPAIWVSGGSGRDGRARRGAPKVGWCWARNRHTWLGFASGSVRAPAA